MPPAKRQKTTQEETYRCTTCFEDKRAGLFPDDCPTEQCQHTIHTCSVCLRKYIFLQLNDQTIPLSCPECDQILQHDDVKRHGYPKDLRKYDKLKHQNELEQDPRYTQCPSRHCFSGQVHDPPVQDFFKLQPAPDVFTCVQCHRAFCLTCGGIPWHVDKTCYEHNREYIQGARAQEDKRGAATVQATTKACPSCATRIAKDGGCDHMYCESFASEGGVIVVRLMTPA